MTDQGQLPDDEQEIRACLHAVNDSMMDGLGKLAEYFGFNQLMGQIYAALLLSIEPLSLDDLAKTLQKSKASISVNIRTFEHLGVVREVWVRGDRHKYYEAETDFWKIAINVLSSRELRDLEQALSVLQQNTTQLRDAMPEMQAEDQALAAFYVTRIAGLEKIFQFAQLLVTSILQRAAQGKFDVGEVTSIKIE